MFKTIIKITLYFIGASILLFIVTTVFVIYAFGGFDKDYSISDLKAHFKENEAEIRHVKKYYNSIVPKDKFVEIEFESDRTIGRLGIQSLDSSNQPTTFLFLDWDLKINSHKTDSVIATLGWNRQTLATLKEKLDKAKCIEIESGHPAKIGFKRSGMGMYFFNVFDAPIPLDKRNHYNNSCRYVLADDYLVLEYAGGAIGPQCFYDFK